MGGRQVVALRVLRRLVWATAFLLLARSTATRAADGLPGLLYATGFEPTEWPGFAPGLLNGQGAPGVWRVSEGEAVIQQTWRARGLQAVQAGSACIQVSFTNREPVVWVDAFFLERGTTNPPLLPTNLAASVVFFSRMQGLWALNGDGQGGGTYEVVQPDFPTNQFIRVTIRHDYPHRLYDVWIDGVQRRVNLGFKDRSVATFSGALRRSTQTSFMDDFSVSVWGLDQDTDGDGLNDLDEAKFYGSHPLLADSDGDGAGDAQEVLAGTDPGDAQSVFALRVDSSGPTAIIRVPTITGRQYTLQKRAALGQGAWENVPGATGFEGDGREQAFLETSDGRNYFYRGVIINR